MGDIAGPERQPVEPHARGVLSLLMIARRLFVAGHVQGVFFREWTVGKARELGVAGWVRNLRDGRVEIYALGPAEAVDRFVARVRQGSPASRVDQVEVEQAEPERLGGFTRRQTA